MVIIMIDNHVTLISEAQERDWYKLLPQPHSTGINYSLFIMVMNEMMLMDANGQLGAVPTASPLLSLLSSNLYCVFFVSPLPRHEIARGIYIVGFRQRNLEKDPWEWKWAPPRGHHLGPCGPTSFLPRGAPRWLLCLTIFVSLKKMM
jgi:hypothetical protein